MFKDDEDESGFRYFLVIDKILTSIKTVNFDVNKLLQIVETITKRVFFYPRVPISSTAHPVSCRHIYYTYSWYK